MGTIVWRKPSGAGFETNDSQATIDYCLKMGMEHENLDPPESEAKPPESEAKPKTTKKGK